MFLSLTFSGIGYTPLTDIGQVAYDLTGRSFLYVNDLGQMMEMLFYVILAVAVILAVYAVIGGGYMYMTSSDNADKKTRAKKKIQAAFGGLLLAFGTVLILQTINPNLVNFSLEFRGLQEPEDPLPMPLPEGSQHNFIYDPETNTFYDLDSGLVYNPQGWSTIPGRVAIDTDGENPPPFYDEHYRNETSLGGLDANVDRYVVVPIGSSIPLGTRVHLYNRTTGRETWAIVGDRGPTANGLGEMSLSAASDIGSWTPGMGNTAHDDHQVVWTFYPQE
jgi:hypothetical protein